MIEQEKKYLDIIDTLVLILDNEIRVKYINKKGQKILGYTENELLGRNWLKMCISGEQEEEIRNVFSKLMKDEKKAEFYENSVLTKNGKEKLISWHNSILYDKKGNFEGVLSVGTDISKQDKIQKLLKINRQANFIISKAKNEIRLYQEFCNKIIQFKNYKFCWIGLVQYDENKSIKPIALTGYDIFKNSRFKGENFKFTWSEEAEDQSPSGIAIRTRSNYITNDLISIKKFKSWNIIFKNSGFLSSLSIPIIIENIVIGVLGVYSGKKNIFDKDDEEILTEMVNNLALEIGKMRYYKIQRKNEKKLRDSLKKFSTIFQAIPDLFFLISNKGKILEFHGNEENLHSPLKEIIGENISNILPQEITEELQEKTIKIYSNKKPQIVEFPIVYPSGNKEIFEARMLYYDAKRMAVFARNITERVSREKILIETEETLRNINSELDQKIINRTKELESTKDQLNLILNSLEEPVLVISKDHDILFHNTSSSKIFGRIYEGQKCYKFLKGREQPCDGFCPLNRILLEQNLKSIKFEEKIFTHRLNKERDMEIKATKMDNFNGNFAIVEIFNDITEQREKEKKIKESELMLQGRIKELKSLYGISSLLVVPDITIKELLYGILPMIRSSWRYPEITMVKIIYGEIIAQTNNYKDSEWKLAIADKINDRTLNIEVLYTTKKTFLYDETRLLREILTRIKLGIISIEYKTEMKRLANIVETSSDSIISMDNDGIIKTWNKGAERIYGYTLEEVLEYSISILVPPDRMHEVPMLIEKVVQGESYDFFETKRLRKDGKELNVNLTLSPILDLKGEVIGISSISRDVTEVLEQQRQYSEQLIKSSQFKSDFMASMSHELRTPLNSIIGFTDILIEKFYGEINEKQDHYLHNVRTSADHLLHLINDILDISKIEAGKVELNFRDFDILNLVNQIKMEMKPQYIKKKLNFEIIGFKKGKIIKADPIRFKEILLNLISNAVKYTEKGSIKLEFFEDEENWNFRLTDTGIGIAKEDFGIIFQEFKRVQSEYVESIEGTGLGLMLTKKLIELHGGHISFTSKLGEGSTFSFTFPKKFK